MSVPKRVRTAIPKGEGGKDTTPQRKSASKPALAKGTSLPRRRTVATSPTKSKQPTPARARVRTAQPKVAAVAAESVIETVSLPTQVSLRAQRKVEAWKVFFDTELPKIMYLTSYAYAVSFVVIGIVLCGFVMIVPPSSQSAQLLTGFASSSEVSNSQPVPGSNVVTAPTVTLIEALPKPMSPGSRFVLTTTQAQDIIVLAESLTTGNRLVLDTEVIAGSSYRVTVPKTVLPAGEYVIRAEVKANATKHSFRLGVTTVEAVKEPEPEPVNQILVPPPVSTETASSSTNTPTNTPPAAATSTEEVVTDVPVVPVTVEEPELATSTPTPLQLPAPPSDQQGFSLTLPNGVLSGWVPIRITAPSTHTKIELYVRPQQSVSERFLGSATKIDKQWFYSFDSRQMPDGLYQLIARAEVAGSRQSSPTAFFEVKNHTTSGEIQKPVTSSTTAQKPVFSVAPLPGRSTINDEQVITEANRAFDAESSSINDLLQRYATALKTEDPTLLAAIDREFEATRDAMLTEQILDPEKRDLVSAMEPEFEARFEELKERVRAFEAIRTERVEATEDTDNDGITDHDELQIYGTDPRLTDSDGDGFLDGVEIVRGYNPTDASAEAIIAYELPTQIVGLERPDVLAVTAVAPHIVEPAADLAKAVHADIAGKGLPNSFVTLFIFSSPIIVTVKTDADGSFVYRFDKELEDGKHEVYVAFTDNTGAILAKSEPFTFVKQAEAFTPTDESGVVAESLETLPDSVAHNSYQLVFGLIIISLGLLLLLLGMSIRPKSEPLVTSQ